MNSRASVVFSVSDERSRCRRLQLTHQYPLLLKDASADMRKITRVDTHAEGEIDGYFRMMLVSAKFILSNAGFADQHEYEGAEAFGQTLSRVLLDFVDFHHRRRLFSSLQTHVELINEIVAVADERKNVSQNGSVLFPAIRLYIYPFLLVSSHVDHRVIPARKTSNYVIELVVGANARVWQVEFLR